MSENPKNLSHGAAIKALCDCAATVTVLSYQEVIEGYFSLRGLSIPGEPASVAVEADRKEMSSPGRYKIQHPDTAMSNEQRAWEMWAVHPTDLRNMGLNREEFFLAHLRAAALSKPTPVEAGLREALEQAADAWDAFVKAREAMNAAVPDLMTGTPAERALYDERYRADHEAEREHFRTAIVLAQSSRSILAALSETQPPRETSTQEKQNG